MAGRSGALGAPRQSPVIWPDCFAGGALAAAVTVPPDGPSAGFSPARQFLALHPLNRGREGSRCGVRYCLGSPKLFTACQTTSRFGGGGVGLGCGGHIGRRTFLSRNGFSRAMKNARPRARPMKAADKAPAGTGSQNWPSTWRHAGSHARSQPPACAFPYVSLWQSVAGPRACR